MIISVVNSKGGIAKTSTCVNLSYALSIMGKRVLTIDFDKQGSLTTLYGYNNRRLDRSMSDVIYNKCSIKDIIINISENLYLAPTTIDLNIADSLIGGELLLQKALEPIKNDYDYIIIDNGPNFSRLTVNSMAVADYIIAPCQAEFLALQGIGIILDIIEQVKNTINPKLNFMGVLITMFDSRTNHHKEITEIIKKNFKAFKEPIVNSIKFPDSTLAKQSIIEFAGKDFEGSKGYINMAEEVLNYEQG